MSKVRQPAIWWLCVVLFLPLARLGASPRYVIRVLRHPSVQLSDGQARLIVSDIQTQLNTSCRQRVLYERTHRPNSRVRDCTVQVSYSSPVATTRPDAAHLQRGKLTGDDVTEILRTNFPADIWTVIVVAYIGKCDSRVADTRTIIRGCSRPRGNIILVTLDGGVPSTTQPEKFLRSWFKRQAILWAHELGHTMGLEDRTAVSDAKYLMYQELGEDHTRLSLNECYALAQTN